MRMYIALEGTKGTGKSTLLEALKLKLQQEKIDFQIFAPTKTMPQDSWWEKAYTDYCQDDVYLESLYTARANFHASQIDFKHNLILGDRSILTSFVTRWPHQDHHQLADYLNYIQKKEFLVPLPDLVLYLDLPLEITLQRLSQRKRQYGLYDEQAERLLQAKNAYETLLQHKNQLGFTQMQYQIVDAGQKQEDLLQNVYALVIQQLENC